MENTTVVAVAAVEAAVKERMRVAKRKRTTYANGQRRDPHKQPKTFPKLREYVKTLKLALQESELANYCLGLELEEHKRTTLFEVDQDVLVRMRVTKAARRGDRNVHVAPHWGSDRSVTVSADDVTNDYED